MKALLIVLCGVLLFMAGTAAGRISLRGEMADRVPLSVALKWIADVEQHSVEEIDKLQKRCVEAIAVAAKRPQ